MKTEHRTTATSRTMRAIVQHTYGIAETLHLADTARPEIAPDEALIEVHAAGVDRGVWHLMRGLPYVVRLTGFGLTRPKTSVPGLDVAGRVAAVGSQVTRFAVGDEVFGIAEGAYAEYATAKESKLAHKPADFTFEQAAVVAISGSTALQALTDVGRIAAGQKVLVVGASGGVGSYAVQIAKALGATVTGVASGAKGDLVRSLGADDVIDYAATDYLDGTTRYDLIIDTGGIGRQLRATAWSLFVPQRMRTFISREHHSDMERLADHLEGGAVVPAVGRRYRLDQVPAAIADLAAGLAAGKSVIVVKDAPDAG